MTEWVDKATEKALRRVALLERLAVVMHERWVPERTNCDCEVCAILRELTSSNLNPTRSPVAHGASSPIPDAERGGSDSAGSAQRESGGRSRDGGGADRVGPFTSSERRAMVSTVQGIPLLQGHVADNAVHVTIYSRDGLMSCEVPIDEFRKWQSILTQGDHS